MAFARERLPECCFGIDCAIGIDEAGRGPVLGPLVYAVFISPITELASLKGIGAADSKSLTIASRENVFSSLEKNASPFGWRTAIVSPETISNCMLQRSKYNLNTLSYDTVFGLVQSLLDQDIRITMAFVDTLGKAEKYEANLTLKFPGIKFTVRPKADSLFPIVGAASIVAKVTRDLTLQQMMLVHSPKDSNGGSGYPGDPDTVDWLQRNVDPVFGYSSALIRFSWSSCQRVLDKNGVQVVWPSDDEQATLPKKGAKESPKKRQKTASTRQMLPAHATW